MYCFLSESLLWHSFYLRLISFFSLSEKLGNLDWLKPCRVLLSSILDRMASGYVPFPNIGSANHPRLNCNALSVASTSSESVLFGISQLLFSEIPTCPKQSTT